MSLNLPVVEETSRCGRWKDVSIDVFNALPEPVLAELGRVAELYETGHFDVLLVTRGLLDHLDRRVRRDERGTRGQPLRKLIVRAVRMPLLRDRERNLYHTDRFTAP